MRSRDTWTPATSKYILEAVACAKRRTPRERSIYTFIADILCRSRRLRREGSAPRSHAFAVSCSKCWAVRPRASRNRHLRLQPPGPLNEVGGEPEHFAHDRLVHQQNRCGAEVAPLATRTAPTIPSAARTSGSASTVLSEVPELAQDGHPSRAGPRTAREVDGASPRRNEQMLVLQTLIGAWPMRPEDAALRRPAVHVT